MHIPQLVCSAVIIAAVAAAPGCSRAERADTRQEAREAAATVKSEVRTATAHAGETLADGWLTTKIQAQYFADQDIKARYLDVSTRDGVVTLSGYVASEAARQQAVQIATNTDGVRRVDDRLLIGQTPANVAAGRPADGAGTSAPGAPVATTGNAGGVAERVLERIDDARITSAVQAKYFLDSVVKARRINVDTRNGVVTLRGEVASQDERAAALMLARNTDGVRRVEDDLTVNVSLAAH